MRPRQLGAPQDAAAAGGGHREVAASLLRFACAKRQAPWRGQSAAFAAAAAATATAATPSAATVRTADCARQKPVCNGSLCAFARCNQRALTSCCCLLSPVMSYNCLSICPLRPVRHPVALPFVWAVCVCASVCLCVILEQLEQSKHFGLQLITRDKLAAGHCPSHCICR